MADEIPLEGKEIEKEVVEVIEEVPEMKSEWKPRTALGKLVQDGVIKDINDIFNQGLPILEAEIVDQLLPDIEEDLLLIGQAKGKFGGGQRRIFRQTQKKTMEGNRIQFSTYCVIGNKDGYVGGALGKSKETVPARDKSKRNARLHMIRVRRGCGSWQCNCKGHHSIPFTIEGRCSSSRITLMPAPRGKGLCVEKECAKILALAGIKDVWSRTKGQTATKVNLIGAVMDALRKLSKVKVQPEDIEKLGVIDGKLRELEARVDVVVPEEKATKSV